MIFPSIVTLPIQSLLGRLSALMSSKKSSIPQQPPVEGTITEPRFSKAHTDRRFAKIGKKDTTVHLDNRFKHIVKDKRFAIAGTPFSSSFSDNMD